MKTIDVEEGQTIYDIAVQEYGCYEGVTLVCQDNDLSLISLLNGISTLQIRDEIPELTSDNKRVVAYLKRKGIKPNTAKLVKVPDYIPGDYIEGDFKTW